MTSVLEQVAALLLHGIHSLLIFSYPSLQSFIAVNDSHNLILVKLPSEHA